MARKTKAELQAEREQQRALAWEIEVAKYTRRLMSALEQATHVNNYELEVLNQKFYLRDRDVRKPEAVAFTLTHTYESQNALENLEWELRIKADQRAEAERQQQAREAALAKLTEEDRELLGL